MFFIPVPIRERAYSSGAVFFTNHHHNHCCSLLPLFQVACLSFSRSHTNALRLSNKAYGSSSSFSCFITISNQPRKFHLKIRAFQLVWPSINLWKVYPMLTRSPYVMWLLFLRRTVSRPNAVTGFVPSGFRSIFLFPGRFFIKCFVNESSTPQRLWRVGGRCT